MYTFDLIKSKYRYQILTLLAHILLLIQYMFLPYWYIVITLMLGWIASSLGHNLFAHRVLTHKHFKFSKTANIIGHTIFALLNIGSIVTYCSVHLKHHRFSGKAHDPHDHYRIGIIRTILNMWDKYYLPEKHTYKIFLNDPLCNWFHKRHEWIALFSSIFTPYLIVVSFWLQRILVIVVHIPKLGYRSPITQKHDTSVNVWWLKPIMLGEELHNNHHLYANKANHNINGNIKEFDPMYYIGKWIERKI